MQKPKNKSPWNLAEKGSYSDLDDSAVLNPLDSDISIWTADIDNSYDKWSWELPPRGQDIYSKYQEAAEEITARWAGALVKFGQYLYARGLSLYDPPNLNVYHRSETTSRIDSPEGVDQMKYPGTVFEVDERPNYKGNWCVSVLWSDGIISYENILDLEIIQSKPD